MDWILQTDLKNGSYEYWSSLVFVHDGMVQQTQLHWYTDIKHMNCTIHLVQALTITLALITVMQSSKLYCLSTKPVSTALVHEI